MFGYAAAEVVGQNVRMLIPDPYRSSHDGYLERYLETGVRRIIGNGRVVLGQHRNGTTFPADLAVSETVTSEGRIFTGCLLNIGGRRELEREVLEVAGHEQRRIGENLHDVVGQELAGLCYISHSLVENLRTKSPADSELASRLADGLESALGRLRDIAKGLIPVDVSPEGLMAALKDQIERTQVNTGICCEFDCESDVSVKNNQVATQLYFIACEGIANAVSHARPDVIRVTLKILDNTLILEVGDDGIGIHKLAAPDGIGLRIMAYRAGLLNGVLSIGHGEDGGTLLTCRIPLDEPDAGSTGTR